MEGSTPGRRRAKHSFLRTPGRPVVAGRVRPACGGEGTCVWQEEGREWPAGAY